jgi:hypothetical protein
VTSTAAKYTTPPDELKDQSLQPVGTVIKIFMYPGVEPFPVFKLCDVVAEQAVSVAVP